MNKNKLLLIFLCACLIFALFKADKIKRYFYEERYYNIFAALGLTKTCYNPYKHNKDVFAQEGFDYIKYNNEVVLDGLKKIDSIDYTLTKYKIPPISHQVYVTPETSNLKVIKDFYIEKLKANFERLNEQDRYWQHYIWTNNPNIFPEELRDIAGVIVKDIKELKDHQLYKNIELTIKKSFKLPAYLAEASDIIRLIVLQKYGGVYSDMDYEIYNSKLLLTYMRNFNFLGGREKTESISYYGNSFIAASLNHPVINQALSMMERNYARDMSDAKTPDYIKYPCTENDRLYFNGPPLITLAYFDKNNLDENKDLILPSWMILNLSFARYKNQTCDYSSITREYFKQRSVNLTQLIKKYLDGYNPYLDEYNYNYSEQPRHFSKQEDNIYYNLKYRKNYNIIGADMGCGTWVTADNPRHWYWK